MFEVGKTYRTSLNRVKLMTYDQLFEMYAQKSGRFHLRPRIDRMYGVYLDGNGRAGQWYDIYDTSGNPVRQDDTYYTEATIERHKLREECQ